MTIGTLAWGAFFALEATMMTHRFDDDDDDGDDDADEDADHHDEDDHDERDQRSTVEAEDEVTPGYNLG